MVPKPPVLSPDQEKILWDKNELNLDSSKGLSRAVIFYLIKSFAVWQGRELRQLETSHVTFGKDDLGLYVAIDLESIEMKQRRTITKRYDDPANPRSVYKIFKKYRGFVANEGPFLVRPINSIKDFICYSPLPLGVGVVTSTIQTLMKDAGLDHAFYGNYSLNLQAIDVLHRFGTGSHCLASWIFASGLKGMPPAPKCGPTNCEGANPEISLMISRLLDAPYPVDAVAMIQKIELEEEKESKKKTVDDSFNSWMSNLNSSKKVAYLKDSILNGKGAKTNDSSCKNGNADMTNSVLRVHVNGESTSCLKNKSSGSRTSQSNSSVTANLDKAENQDNDLMISSISSISESAFDAQISENGSEETGSSVTSSVVTRKRSVPSEFQEKLSFKKSKQQLSGCSKSHESKSKHIGGISDGNNSSCEVSSSREKSNCDEVGDGLSLNFEKDTAVELERKEVSKDAPSSMESDNNENAIVLTEVKREVIDCDDLEGETDGEQEIAADGRFTQCVNSAPRPVLVANEAAGTDLPTNVALCSGKSVIVSHENDNEKDLQSNKCETNLMDNDNDDSPSSVSREANSCQDSKVMSVDEHWKDKEDATMPLSPRVTTSQSPTNDGGDNTDHMPTTSNGEQKGHDQTDSASTSTGTKFTTTSSSTNSTSSSSTPTLVSFLNGAHRHIERILNPSNDGDDADKALGKKLTMFETSNITKPVNGVTCVAAKVSEMSEQASSNELSSTKSLPVLESIYSTSSSTCVATSAQEATSRVCHDNNGNTKTTTGRKQQSLLRSVLENSSTANIKGKPPVSSSQKSPSLSSSSSSSLSLLLSSSSSSSASLPSSSNPLSLLSSLKNFTRGDAQRSKVTTKKLPFDQSIPRLVCKSTASTPNLHCSNSNRESNSAVSSPDHSSHSSKKTIATDQCLNVPSPPPPTASDLSVKLILSRTLSPLIPSSQSQPPSLSSSVPAITMSPSSSSSSTVSSTSSSSLSTPGQGNTNTATFSAQHDKAVSTIFRTLEVFDQAKDGIHAYHFADIPSKAVTSHHAKEKTNECVISSNTNCKHKNIPSNSIDHLCINVTNQEEHLVDVAKHQKGTRSCTTSVVNLGDYFPSGTLIPADYIQILTQEGENGSEVVMKFGFNQNEAL